jgi:putative transposase
VSGFSRTSGPELATLVACTHTDLHISNISTYSSEIGGKLWQRYGYERTLRKEEDTLTAVRYIIENPLRAGLVERIEDYAFIGSMVCELKDLLASQRERAG